MSNLRSHGGRGPADSHIADRFSTTYSTSYRPFNESGHRHIPIRCVAGSKGSSSLINGTGSSLATASSSTNPYRSSIIHSSSIASPGYTYPCATRGGVGRSGAITRQPWDDGDAPITNDHTRPKPPNMCLSGAGMHRTAQMEPTNHVGSQQQQNYKTTYTTTVAADRVTPCYLLSSQDCDKAVQVSTLKSATACAGQPRTLATVSPTLGCRSKLDCPSTSSASRITASGDRSLLVTPISPAYTFDVGQMFSQIARINNHLYLSSLSALSPERLRQHGITLLVSAMIDPPPLQLRNAVTNCIHVCVEDMEGANLRVHFDRVADRIATEQRRGGRALVHCMAGVSRSSSLIMAYMIRHLNMSLADAYQHVRAIRPCIQPNPSFWRQLLDYEERLRGSRTVRLLPPMGYLGSCALPGHGGRMYPSERSVPRTSYMDLYSRPTGELLPYRPLTSMHSMDTGKPYIGCRQQLG